MNSDHNITTVWIGLHMWPLLGVSLRWQWLTTCAGAVLRRRCIPDLARGHGHWPGLVGGCEIRGPAPLHHHWHIHGVSCGDDCHSTHDILWQDGCAAVRKRCNALCARRYFIEGVISKLGAMVTTLDLTSGWTACGRRFLLKAVVLERYAICMLLYSF